VPETAIRLAQSAWNTKTIHAPLDFLVEGRRLTGLSLGATLALVMVLLAIGIFLEVNYT
jgi:hypothetical protein